MPEVPAPAVEPTEPTQPDVPAPSANGKATDASVGTNISVSDANPAPSAPETPTTAPPLPNGTDQVQVNQVLSQTMNDLETFKNKLTLALGPLLNVHDFGTFIGHVNAAQDWVADRLGLEKHESGGFQASTTNPAPPTDTSQPSTPTTPTA